MEIVMAIAVISFAAGFVYGVSNYDIMRGRKGRVRARMARCKRCNRVLVYEGRSMNSEVGAIYTFTQGG